MKVLIIIAVTYTLYLSVLFISQRKMLFPSYMIPVPPQPADLKEKNIDQGWIETEGYRSETLFLPAQSQTTEKKGVPKSPVIIFAHGNGELIDFWVDELIHFSRHGFSVLLPEYPGYGRSTGTTTQKSITDAFIKAYDNLLKREDVDPDKIIFLGRSIGGGAVCSLARHRKPAALILMSTFINTRSFAKKYLAPGALILDTFENLKLVQNYNGPVLIMHGEKDELIPYDHGLQLYNASKNGKLITYQAGHNDCPPDFNAFIQDVKTFLIQHHLHPST